MFDVRHLHGTCGACSTCAQLPEQHAGATQEEGMDVIQSNHMERALQLEALELEARSEYERTLAERGGQ